MAQATYPELLSEDWEASRLPPAAPVNRRASFAPAWSCSRWGLPGRRIAASAGGLLHRRFTLTSCLAVCFCGPIQKVTPLRGLPGIALYGVRTFLDPAAGKPAVEPRSPDRPGCIHDTLIKGEGQYHGRVRIKRGICFAKKIQCETNRGSRQLSVPKERG
jgi:hypothetical protein